MAAAALVSAVPANAGPDFTTAKAIYMISIAGIPVGRVEAESRFTANAYATAISGSTSGLSRLVSDASAKLAGSGRYNATRVQPTSYILDTNENGFETHVNMTMRAGKIVGLVAVPPLSQAADRVPVTARHKINVVDPIAAFIVPLDRPGPVSGQRACARTVKVFDGWTRYDIRLSYKLTKMIAGGPDAYSGPVIVCAARFVPIAGHRTTRKSIQSMANNTRLEIWLAPISNMPLLVPYRIVVGTDIGDLTITAMRFSVEAPERHAEAK
jgi:hypothetical protein